MYICTDFYFKGWTDGTPHLMHAHEAGSISLQPNNMDETKITITALLLKFTTTMHYFLQASSFKIQIEVTKDNTDSFISLDPLLFHADFLVLSIYCQPDDMTAAAHPVTSFML